MHTLKIENLNVTVENKKILNNFNLEIKSGEIHAIMGPNGTGKSTLLKVIMGDSNYTVESGNIYFDETVLNELTVSQRANLGIFLGMQLPPEIEGVTNADFLRTALHTKQKEQFKLFSFIKKLDENVEKLKMDKNMIHRDINEGFSGGERKKNEILQMYTLEPSIVMLDEIDSGLDVDSLKIVGQNVMDYYKQNSPALLVITHYQRLLDYIIPTHVHIMKNGTIIKSGDNSLVDYIEKNGYDNIEENQILHIKRILNHGGIVFLIIFMNNKFYLLKGSTLINFINNNERKSIPFDVINEYAYIIKEGFIPRLDYLSVVEKVYLKEGENEISK